MNSVKASTNTDIKDFKTSTTSGKWLIATIVGLAFTISAIVSAYIGTKVSRTASTMAVA